jgi:FkbM family methyltransferase
MRNPLRHYIGRKVHRLIDRRLDQRLGAALPENLDRARRRWLDEPLVFGPPEHLVLDPTCVVNNALFNTISGTVTVERGAFFGHSVLVLCGRHDVNVRGDARKDAYRVGPNHGFDVWIGPGAWVASRAVLIGPCRIGADAVVCAGAVVTHDVEPGTMVAGVPARVIRRLPVDAETAAGAMYLHANDEVITPDLQRGGTLGEDHPILRELAAGAGVVVDVGANVGFAALTAAGAGARVIAIEPHPENVRLLRANVERNGADVRVVAAAAWDAPGVVKLAEATTNTGDHRAGVSIAGRTELEVPALRIDDVVAPEDEVGVIKLDTQATEHVALRGARELLKRCRPVLLVEFWPKAIRDLEDDPVAVLREYADLGYRRTVVEDPELTELDDAELVERAHARPGPEGGWVTLRLDPLE